MAIASVMEVYVKWEQQALLPGPAPALRLCIRLPDIPNGDDTLEAEPKRHRRLLRPITDLGEQYDLIL